MMMNFPSKPRPSRIDFDGVTRAGIERILSTHTLDALTPAEREYYSLMELVRGLRARMTHAGGQKIVTKAGIIKLLKSDAYGLSDWMARKVYADSLNFFYSQDDVTPRAWSNFYADRLEKLADMAAATGHFKDARGFYKEAAKLRGCYDAVAPSIPDELLNPATMVIYTTDAASMGAPDVDRKELEAFIDFIPDVPDNVRRQAKEDAGILKRNLLDKMLADAKEFAESEE